MADVQLERGHVRIANRLYEAILYADMTDTQRRIVMALVRLTYGWRRRTVVVSTAQLAGYCHCQPSGSFRKAFDELSQRGVVRVIRRGDGPASSVLAVEKDFTKWGRFGTSEGCLSDIYGQRPEHADDLLPTREPSSEGDPLEAPPGEGTPQEGASRESPGVPPERQGVCLSEGTLTPPNDAHDKQLGARKDIDRQLQTSTTSSSPAASPERRRLEAELAGQSYGELAIAALDTLLVAARPRETTWVALLLSYVDGPGAPKGQRVPGVKLLASILEYNTHDLKGAAPSPMHFRKFVEKIVADTEATPERVVARSAQPKSWDDYNRENGLGPYAKTAAPTGALAS